MCAGNGTSTVLSLHGLLPYHLDPCRYSVLPALSLDGILWCKIIEGAFNFDTFHEFITELLECMQPFPNPNSVIVMDNARIHKNPDTIEMIRSR